MQWLKANAEVIDWSECPALRAQVLEYGEEPAVPPKDNDDDIPF